MTTGKQGFRLLEVLKIGRSKIKKLKKNKNSTKNWDENFANDANSGFCHYSSDSQC